MALGRIQRRRGLIQAGDSSLRGCPRGRASWVNREEKEDISGWRDEALGEENSPEWVPCLNLSWLVCKLLGSRHQPSQRPSKKIIPKTQTAAWKAWLLSSRAVWLGVARHLCRASVFSWEVETTGLDIVGTCDVLIKSQVWKHSQLLKIISVEDYYKSLHTYTRDKVNIPLVSTKQMSEYKLPCSFFSSSFIFLPLHPAMSGTLDEQVQRFPQIPKPHLIF